MKATMKRIISIGLIFLLMFSVIVSSVVIFNAESNGISYVFSGEHSQDRGYAQGEITLSANAGTYWLYWADENSALEGYGEIAKLVVADTKVTHSMHKQTAIPVEAEYIIAVKADSEPMDKSVDNAYAVYEIPANKKWNFSAEEKIYSFMSASDIHIDLSYETYQYAEEHWAMALDVATDRNADFIITSGDAIQNKDSVEGVYAGEWKKYQKILAESDFTGPVYEAIGNHEIYQDVKDGTKAFINATGLEGNNNTSAKAYFEKELFGDHFIFMSLEGGFYPDRVDEFTNEQLDWLEGLLKKYSGDGKNIYIIEHSPFYKYGAGDRVDDEPYYDIPLSDDYVSNKRFKTLLEAYQNTIFISGHTHIGFQYQMNYSDNNGTSARMLHNSSVGGVREIVNGSLERNYGIDETEAYIVDVYGDAIIFNGANLYNNGYDPNCCYLVSTSQDKYDEMGGTIATQATTESTTATETVVYEASDIYLKGSFNSWGTSNPLYSTSNATIYTATLQLSAGTYEFKLNKGSTWYGNGGTIENTTTATSKGGWVMGTSDGNCKLVATGGYYQFDFDTSNNKLKVFYYAENPNEPAEAVILAEEVVETAELGDVDLNGTISINDVTRIQLDISNIVPLTSQQKAVADANSDGNVDVKDATTIQKFIVKLITSFDDVDIGDETLDSALASAKKNLDLYYRYSSYDCYQALKKEYYLAKDGEITDEETAIKNIITLKDKLLTVVDTTNVDYENSTVTVYFENTENWSVVNAYCWGDSQYKAWPGEKCQLAGINDAGHQVYKYTVDTEKYDFIIFNNGSDKQTKDMYIADHNVCYTPHSTTSPYEVTFAKIVPENLK